MFNSTTHLQSMSRDVQSTRPMSMFHAWHVSLRLTASILSWLSSRREPDLLLTSSSGKWQQQHSDKTTQQNNSVTSERQEKHTLIHPGYRVTSPKHWKLSWMLHDCKDWSFQDTTTRKLFHSAALPINPFAHTAKSWSNPRRCRVNLELKWNQLFSQPMQISVGS